MTESLLRDIRLALRSLRRSPLFTVATVLTLALGIGGTTAMFTAVNAAFLQSLPYPNADHLVKVWQTSKKSDHIPVSILTFFDWVSDSHSFDHLAAYQANTSNVTSGAEPRRVPIAQVTQDFFATMGVSPLQGRTFSAEESHEGGPRAVIIGDRLRRQVLPGEPDAIGKKLEVDAVTYVVIGVMPEGFSFPENAELWLPLPTSGGDRSAHNYEVVARIKPTVGLNQAQEDMNSVAKRLAETYPATDGKYGARVGALRQELLGHTGPVLLMLLGAVFFVLVIASVNVINLLFVRAVARQGETTVRLALGANRSALVRPFLIESVLLAFIGGALGLLVALASERLLSGFTLNAVLNPRGLRLDTAVLLFTFLVTLAVGLICGLAPAIQAFRQDLRTTLASGGRSVLGNAGRRAMNGLIVAEVAVAFVLLVGAGLLIQSVRRLEAVDPGFKARNVALLTFSVGGPSGTKYDDAKWRSRFFSDLLARTSALANVHAAGVITQAPLSGGSFNGTLEVDQAGDQASQPEAHYRLIGGRYFAALSIPVLRGRDFSPQDREGTPWVAIVSSQLARAISGDGDVIGKRVRIPGMDEIKDWATIVGVVGDVHHRGLARAPLPEIYFPFEQRPERTWEMALVVQAVGGATSLGQEIHEAVRAIDPTIPVEVTTMDGLLAADLAQPRFRATLLGVFAAVALVLAAVGIFGVVSYAVGRRSREVSIRVALGSSRAAILKLILRDGMIPVLLGIAIGTAFAYALTRVLTSVVFEVKTTDPLTFIAVALSLAAIALAANYIPARRATRIDPVDVLRAD
jgi:putative ABC transport system permease protein